MAIEQNDNLYLHAGKHIDAKYFNENNVRYPNVEAVYARIPKAERVLDGEHNVNGVKYWFHTNLDTLEICPGQVAPDWNAAEGQGGYIANKPDMATQIQSDWDQTDPEAKDFIKNKKPFLTDQYNWKLKSVVGVVSVNPTPPTTAEILANKPYFTYGNSGAQVYMQDGASYIPDPSVPIITTDVVWMNTAGNTTDGVLNRCGVWSTMDSTNGQYIGFGREVIVTVPKIYYIGLGADNYMSLEINNVLIKDFPPGDSLDDHYRTWHLLPVFLNVGSNIIHMVGYNDTGVAAFGAEIYDATLEELQAVATIAALTARTIFSTKSLIGGYVEEGNFGTGYTCPDGYALINRDGVYSCDKFEYGSITVDKHDLVEFRKGAGSEFTASVDPLDSTHKYVEIPVGENVFDIVFPYASTVQGRCDGVIDIPEGWTVAAAPDNQYDLLISHYLNRRFAMATVTAVAGVTEQLLQNNGAFSGIIAQTKSVLRIQGLTDKSTPLVVHLIFS